MRHNSSRARSASGAVRRRPAASTTVQCVVAKMSPGAELGGVVDSGTKSVVLRVQHLDLGALAGLKRDVAELNPGGGARLEPEFLHPVQ